LGSSHLPGNAPPEFSPPAPPDEFDEIENHEEGEDNGGHEKASHLESLGEERGFQVKRTPEISWVFAARIAPIQHLN
jgi:hypothetical protein